MLHGILLQIGDVFRSAIIITRNEEILMRITRIFAVAIMLLVGPPAFAQGGEASAKEAKGSDVESSASSKTTLIDQSLLVGMPLNGRSYTQLVTLDAGVSDPSSASASRGVTSANLTFSGSRSTSNSYLLDGTNIMDAQNRVPLSAAGVQLGSDSVFQVQVFSANYGPEYGRGNGGVLNSITRSGSNEFHGTFFEYLRNCKTESRNFF